MASEQKFYVYTLAYPDGKVFYVGKGTKKRIEDHYAEARSGYTTPKCEVIRAIWNKGEQVLEQKVAFFENEDEAYSFEETLITSYGAKDLTNRIVSGHRQPCEHRGGKYATTINIEQADREAIARIRELYGCPSDSAAIKLAVRMVARGESSAAAAGHSSPG